MNKKRRMEPLVGEKRKTDPLLERGKSMESCCLRRNERQNRYWRGNKDGTVASTYCSAGGEAGHERKNPFCAIVPPSIQTDFWAK